MFEHIPREETSMSGALHMSPPERVKLWQGSLDCAVAPSYHAPVYQQDPRLVYASPSPYNMNQQPQQPNLIYDPLQRHQQQATYLPSQVSNTLANLPYYPGPVNNSSPVKLVSSVLPSNVRGANEESEMGSPLRYYGWNDGHSRMDSLASTVYSHWVCQLARPFTQIDMLTSLDS